jgi:hypothetical protein
MADATALRKSTHVCAEPASNIDGPPEAAYE